MANTPMSWRFVCPVVIVPCFLHFPFIPACELSTRHMHMLIRPLHELVAPRLSVPRTTPGPRAVPNIHTFQPEGLLWAAPFQPLDSSTQVGLQVSFRLQECKSTIQAIKCLKRKKPKRQGKAEVLGTKNATGKVLPKRESKEKKSVQRSLSKVQERTENRA